MSDTIRKSRVLLRLFAQSDYGELHIRDGDFQMFVARTAGRSNPMRGHASMGALVHPAMPQAAAQTAAFVVSAPHIATLVSTLPVGSAVMAGDMVARIALLDELIDIPAEQPGMVDAVLAQPGALIEFATPILSLISVA
jgi:biotin carboxyl carrier protein